MCTSNARMVVGANATSSRPSGARPSMTTRSKRPLIDWVPNVGTGRPFIRTARAHSASSDALTAGSCATFRCTVCEIGAPPLAIE